MQARTGKYIKKIVHLCGSAHSILSGKLAWQRAWHCAMCAHYPKGVAVVESCIIHFQNIFRGDQNSILPYKNFFRKWSDSDLACIHFLISTRWTILSITWKKLLPISRIWILSISRSYQHCPATEQAIIFYLALWFGQSQSEHLHSVIYLYSTPIFVCCQVWAVQRMLPITYRTRSPS